METFELKRSIDRRYFFTFRAGNGHAIADSPMHDSKQDALDAIRLLRLHAHDALLQDLTQEPEED